MSTRQKQTVKTNITAEQLRDALGAYAAADKKISKINADLDIKITAMREQRAAELAALNNEKNAAFATVQTYAVENKELRFKKRKSKEFAHGVYGFRTGTPKLKQKKGYTWKKILNLLQKHLPAYVRTIHEAAKDRILADRNTPEVAEHLAAVGIEVIQEESFFIELKKEAETLNT